MLKKILPLVLFFALLGCTTAKNSQKVGPYLLDIGTSPEICAIHVSTLGLTEKNRTEMSIIIYQGESVILPPGYSIRCDGDGIDVAYTTIPIPWQPSGISIEPKYIEEPTLGSDCAILKYHENRGKIILDWYLKIGEGSSHAERGINFFCTNGAIQVQ